MSTKGLTLKMSFDEVETIYELPNRGNLIEDELSSYVVICNTVFNMNHLYGVLMLKLKIIQYGSR